MRDFGQGMLEVERPVHVFEHFDGCDTTIYVFFLDPCRFEKVDGSRGWVRFLYYKNLVFWKSFENV